MPGCFGRRSTCTVTRHSRLVNAWSSRTTLKNTRASISWLTGCARSMRHPHLDNTGRSALSCRAACRPLAHAPRRRYPVLPGSRWTITAGAGVGHLLGSGDEVGGEAISDEPRVLVEVPGAA